MKCQHILLIIFCFININATVLICPVRTPNLYSSTTFEAFPFLSKPQLSIPEECKKIILYDYSHDPIGRLTLNPNTNSDTISWAGNDYYAPGMYDSISIKQMNNYYAMHKGTYPDNYSSYTDYKFNKLSDGNDSIIYSYSSHSHVEKITQKNFYSNINSGILDSILYYSSEYSSSASGNGSSYETTCKYYPTYTSDTILTQIIGFQKIAHETQKYDGLNMIHETYKDTALDSCIFTFHYNSSNQILSSERIIYRTRHSDIHLEYLSPDTSYYTSIKDTLTKYYPKLIEHYKYDYTYDQITGLIDSEYVNAWDSTSNNFHIKNTAIHTFQPDSQLTKFYSCTYNSDTLVSSGYLDFLYDNQNRFTILKRGNDTLQIFEYDSANHILQNVKLNNNHIFNVNYQNNILNIKFNLPKSNIINVNLYSLSGRRIKTIYKNKKFNSGKPSLSYQLSNISSGAYIVSIETEFGKFNKTIMVK